MDRTRRVTALMTAESIIVAFLVAYGPTVNSTLVSLMASGKPIFGTVLAGLLISAVALTAFRSILLLYQSIDISNLDDVRHSDERYRAGYDLFLMVIAGSGVYVLINAYSILHYAMIGENVDVPEPLSISIAGSFFVAWVLLVVFKPLELTKCIRSTRSRHGNLVFGFLVVFLVCGMIGVEAMILPLSLLLGWPSWPWPIVFAVTTTVVALWIACGRLKRDKTK